MNTTTAQLEIIIEGDMVFTKTESKINLYRWSDMQSTSDIREITQRIFKVMRKYDTVRSITLKLSDGSFYSDDIQNATRFLTKWKGYVKAVWNPAERCYKEIGTIEGETITAAAREYNKALKAEIKAMFAEFEKQHLRKMHELLKNA